MVVERSTNVSAAFDMLLESIDEEIAHTNRAMSVAAERGDYAAVQQALSAAQQMMAYRERVVALHNEWPGSSIPRNGRDGGEVESDGEPRRYLGRLQRGLRTPEEAYVVPILRALVALGGSGRVSDVLDRVLQQVQGILRDVDFESSSHERGEPRWRNTARWARQRLVDDGLVSGDSPYGIWEITEAGRRYLEEQEA